MVTCEYGKNGKKHYLQRNRCPGVCGRHVTDNYQFRDGVFVSYCLQQRLISVRCISLVLSSLTDYVKQCLSSSLTDDRFAVSSSCVLLWQVLSLPDARGQNINRCQRFIFFGIHRIILILTYVVSLINNKHQVSCLPLATTTYPATNSNKVLIRKMLKFLANKRE